MYINDSDNDASSFSPFPVLDVVSSLSPTSPPPSPFIIDVPSRQTDEKSIPLFFPAQLDDIVLATTHSLGVNTTSNSTSDLTTEVDAVGVQLPVGVVIVIVLAAACVLLGAVYGYIYFTRIGTRSTTSNPSKARKSVSGASGLGASDHHGGHHGSGDTGHDDVADSPFTYTHMFLFRKHSSHRATIT